MESNNISPSKGITFHPPYSPFLTFHTTFITEIRDKLMANQGDETYLQSDATMAQHIEYTYNMFNTALNISKEKDAYLSYVAWKRFLVFTLHKLPKHPKFTSNVLSVDKFKCWVKEACKYAFSELESIVEIMDREMMKASDDNISTGR